MSRGFCNASLLVLWDSGSGIFFVSKSASEDSSTGRGHMKAEDSPAFLHVGISVTMPLSSLGGLPSDGFLLKDKKL